MSNQPLRPANVKSKSFLAWFQDSKVVDPKGRPLRVYHGFTQGRTDRFRPYAYFGFDRGLAETYAYDSGHPEPEVVEVYLSLQNPFILTTGEGLQAMWEESGALHAPCDPDGPSDSFLPLHKWLEGRGYDGLMVLPSAFEDDLGYEWGCGTFGEPQLVAFRPTAIKSTLNSGRFDPEDPCIYS